MLLTKILVAFQLLHYCSVSAHPLSISRYLVKRAENLVNPVSELALHEGPVNEGLRIEKGPASEDLELLADDQKAGKRAEESSGKRKMVTEEDLDNAWKDYESKMTETQYERTEARDENERIAHLDNQLKEYLPEWLAPIIKENFSRYREILTRKYILPHSIDPVEENTIILLSHKDIATKIEHFKSENVDDIIYRAYDFMVWKMKLVAPNKNIYKNSSQNPRSKYVFLGSTWH
ncbi:hypothetical protein PGT21_015588 [Puccinia graminis f. sp. tritici]|uniref:Uncharacterized protein n=1 Tax=Puccinia graminis f. sp. tritici TaxID=56615 RepID=A0A5B0MWC3_PUCGR|nr:hypothetical protein PGT21_015588 [Puccinia graminis f. sp. tritici]